MSLRLLSIFITLFFYSNIISASTKGFNQPFIGSSNSCIGIEGIFFDLGDTLVESAGNGQSQLRPGAAQMIETLKLQGIRLGIITNVPSNWSIDDLEAILVDPTFLKDFEAVILSSQAPAPKPDPAIFNFAYSLFVSPPAIENIAFVTETLEHIANFETNPTLGARAVGMKGIHFSNNPPSSLSDYTVLPDDFQAIVDIVNETVFCNGFE